MNNNSQVVSYSVQKHRATIIEWMSDLQEIERAKTDTRRPGAEMAEEYFTQVHESVIKHCGAISVAEILGVPVGFIAGWSVSDDDVILTPQANHYGYISDVYVVKDFRGKGIFQELMKSAKGHFMVMGETSIRINVVAGNEQALKAYLKIGFEPEEISLRMELK